MAEVKKYEDGVTDIEFSSGNKLAFTEGEAAVVLKDRTKLHTFLKLITQVDRERRHAAAAWEGNVTVVSVGGLNPHKWEKGETFYYRAQFDGHPYFIKRLPSSYGKEYGGGHREMMDSREAKQLIKDMPNVEIVSYTLGYESPEDWFFVSTWNDAFQTTLDGYLKVLLSRIRAKDANSDAAQEEYNGILDRVKVITQRLRPFYDDIMTYNMAYDPATKNIYLFDLNKKERINKNLRNVHRHPRTC